MTYNSVALTKAGESDDANFLNAEIWYLVAPTTGSNNIVVTWGGTNGARAVGGIGLSGVHQTVTIGTPAQTSGSGAAATATPASAVGDLVVATISSDSEGGITESGTLRWEIQNVGADCSFGAQTYAGASPTVAVAWTQGITGWAVVAVSFKPAAAGETITIDKWEPKLRHVSPPKPYVVPSGTIGIKNAIARARWLQSLKVAA